ncbi:MAG: EboA domain-containing protein [Methylococcaceae bacterium]
MQSCLDQLGKEGPRHWFVDRIKTIKSNFSINQLYIQFGMVKRKIPDQPLLLKPEQIYTLQQINPAFRVDSWTLQDWCRLALIQMIPVEQQAEILEPLFESADKGELIVLYRSLPFMQNQHQFIHRGSEGIRTNMIDVFDAITAHNPFPAKHFGENAWNQLVIKSIFLERPLFTIWGLDNRHNSTLAMMAQDFAHERWAANRLVTPELWRLLTGFLNETNFKDIQKIITTGDELSNQAGIRIIEESDHQLAKDWLRANNISSATMSWYDIGISANKTNI